MSTESLSEMDLLVQVKTRGARPFSQQVVRSPWQSVVDVPTLNKGVKERIREVIGHSNTDNPHCLTIIAPPGYGKTHLLAHTRAALEKENSTLFVYVPPYTPDNDSFGNHLVRATLDSLRRRSLRQAALFQQMVRSFLVEVYDQMINDNQNLRELRAGGFWTRLFQKRRLKLSGRSSGLQEEALPRAFHARVLLQQAFNTLREKHAQTCDELNVEWDAFVAICLLACGNTQQRWHAENWLHNQFMPLEVLESYHIESSCSGETKPLNVLYTIHKVMNRGLCFAFDQMEDTFSLLLKSEKAKTELMERYAGALRNLSHSQGFTLLFLVQRSIWSALQNDLPKMLRDRMLEGGSVPRLESLRYDTARDLICARMQSFVWSKLSTPPPDDNLCWPFSESSIEEMRLQANSEIRSFLHLAQLQYEELLQSELGIDTSPPIEITQITPSIVVSHEPTPILIRANNLPSDVEVHFGETMAAPESIACRTEDGEIDVTTPTGLKGEIKVLVLSADNPQNQSSATLSFSERQIPKPYAKHVDRSLLRQRRNELDLSQKDVGEMLGLPQTTVSAIERGKRHPEDEVFVKMAEIYKKPLSDFIPKRGK